MIPDAVQIIREHFPELADIEFDKVVLAKAQITSKGLGEREAFYTWAISDTGGKIYALEYDIESGSLPKVSITIMPAGT